VSRDRNLSFAAAPNVVTPAAADKNPTEGPELALEVRALHDPSIHIYVYLSTGCQLTFSKRKALLERRRSEDRPGFL
jgi:hypothetical protein